MTALNHREACGVCHRSPCACDGDSFVFPGGPDMASMDQMSNTPSQEDPYVGLAREYNAVCDRLTAATARIAELEAALGRADRENEAMKALLTLAGQPDCCAYTLGTDSWFAQVEELHSAETAEELAEQLGLIAEGKTNG